MLWDAVSCCKLSASVNWGEIWEAVSWIAVSCCRLWEAVSCCMLRPAGSCCRLWVAVSCCMLWVAVSCCILVGEADSCCKLASMQPKKLPIRLTIWQQVKSGSTTEISAYKAVFRIHIHSIRIRIRPNISIRIGSGTGSELFLTNIWFFLLLHYYKISSSKEVN